jgi:hypothetical protein
MHACICPHLEKRAERRTDIVLDMTPSELQRNERGKEGDRRRHTDK